MWASICNLSVATCLGPCKCQGQAWPHSLESARTIEHIGMCVHLTLVWSKGLQFVMVFRAWRKYKSHLHFGQLLSYPHFTDETAETRGDSVTYPKSVCSFLFSGHLISLLRVSMKTASTSSFSCCNQIREWESLKQERIKIASNARIRPDFTADPSCLSSAAAPAGCLS